MPSAKSSFVFCEQNLLALTLHMDVAFDMWRHIYMHGPTVKPLLIGSSFFRKLMFWHSIGINTITCSANYPYIAVSNILNLSLDDEMSFIT